MGAIPSLACIGLHSRYNWNQLQHTTGYLKRQARPCGQDKWHPNRCHVSFGHQVTNRKSFGYKLFSLPARRNLKQKFQEHRLRQMRTMTFSTQWKIHFQLYQRKLGLQLWKSTNCCCVLSPVLTRCKYFTFCLIQFHPVVFCSCIWLHPLKMISLLWFGNIWAVFGCTDSFIASATKCAEEVEAPRSERGPSNGGWMSWWKTLQNIWSVCYQ